MSELLNIVLLQFVPANDEWLNLHSSKCKSDISEFVNFEFEKLNPLIISPFGPRKQGGNTSRNLMLRKSAFEKSRSVVERISPVFSRRTASLSFSAQPAGDEGVGDTGGGVLASETVGLLLADTETSSGSRSAPVTL
ncbi:hypothetical protein SES60163_12851 [Salmonella enterica subsp. salamae serovar 58:l,z13,z28:z6 str. 00-0163]|nr:hypothetical protein SES60163_12851 [Salmonella enterica subsp. salamae serovar 58:l,z13,z28:z6 str. 00-0163]